MLLVASLKRYSLMAEFTSRTVSLKRLSTQRVASEGCSASATMRAARCFSELSVGVPSSPPSSMFISIKRVAFQSLLIKCRLPCTRSSENLMSRPWAANAASVKRKASAPYFSIIVSGSTTLPLDLDIFTPSGSLTSACRYTSPNGASPINLRPIIIMRATQKNSISNPVTSTVVG